MSLSAPSSSSRQASCSSCGSAAWRVPAERRRPPPSTCFPSPVLYAISIRSARKRAMSPAAVTSCPKHGVGRRCGWEGCRRNLKFQAKITRTLLVSALAMTCPIIAQAAAIGCAKSNVVLRSGPNTRFPAVGMVLAGSRVHIFGCTREIRWCDVTISGRRGWMPSAEVDIEYRRRRLPISIYIRIAQKPDIAIVSFDIDTYWSRNYSQLYFYDEIANWRNIN
ncbi:SH3 domain-containing protein [Rhizobium sp. NPDC090279]|uniref:SH3 domain-containing protein n=1 Tax=Rhizobium sp. NPDC090279 TaxID=3364499 RepID=UPI00383BC143